MVYNVSSRSGQINNSGDDTALFLKVFSGEVLSVFEETNVMMPLHRVRTISSGKSAQFPVTGVATAAYHTPGESLFGDEYGNANTPTYLSKPKHAEKIIFIDGVLQASAFLAQIDEAMNHYDVRSIYSTEIGRQLSYHADKACVRTVIGAARKTTDRFGTGYVSSTSGSVNPFLGNKIAVAKTTASPTFTANEIVADGFTGATLPGGTAPTAIPTGDSLVAGLFTAARLMDEKDVPQQGRYCLLSPTLYYKLVNENKDAINRDYGNEGNGSVAGGEIMRVAGIRIVKSNHIPTASEVGGVLDNPLIKNDVFAAAGSGYASPGGETLGIIFQSEGIGTVKLLDLAVESEYFMERMGTLLMAKYAMGHGILREECCFELYKE